MIFKELIENINLSNRVRVVYEDEDSDLMCIKEAETADFIDNEELRNKFFGCNVLAITALEAGVAEVELQMNYDWREWDE